MLKTKKLCSLRAEKFDGDLEVQFGSPTMWRHLRIPGKLSLAVFHRVLLAASDQAWNPYFFCDLTDGAVWCSFDIDEERSREMFIDALDPNGATVGDVLSKSGDILGYVLKWNHRHAIRFEAICSESQRRVVLLAGGSNVKDDPSELDIPTTQRRIDAALEVVDDEYDEQKEKDLFSFPVRRCTTCAKAYGDVPLRACSRCREVYYCSRECQEEDWRNGHKTSCAGVRSKKNADRFKSHFADGLRRRQEKFDLHQQRRQDQFNQKLEQFQDTIAS